MDGKKIYVIATAFRMDEFIGLAYGAHPYAFTTRDEARRFLVEVAGWTPYVFHDDVYDTDREFFERGTESAKIEEVTVMERYEPSDDVDEP